MQYNRCLFIENDIVFDENVLWKTGLPRLSSSQLQNLCVLENNNFRCAFVFLDDDECATGTHNCNNQALCSNTQGGFKCSCKKGYTGNGVSCTGELMSLANNVCLT